MSAETTTDTTPGSPLAIHTAASALAGFAATAVWGLTGGGTFWPLWVWFGLLVPLSLHAAVRFALDSPAPYPPSLRIHAAVSVAIAGIEILIWALTGFGDLWFLWPILALTVALAAHVLFRRLVLGHELEGLQERVDELTRTRQGAVDVQAAELRRIERDLHDGAQARLVALTMQLGRAEQQLEDRPEVAELVRSARAEAGNAIAELRDLARGIAPPVLADRGLAPAVEALAKRSPVDVEVTADVEGRLPAAVETAAYFVIAEALTNVAKHAPGASAHVTIVAEPRRLVITVADDGPGGADEHGGGLSGLRARVEAIDGRLRVTSPPRAGTTIRAELPCGS
jgi:signal transduction histidine kinase